MTMPTPDRDMDAEVWEKIFGGRRASADDPYWNSLASWIDANGERWEDIPDYSTDIAAVFTILDLFDEVDLHKGPHGWLCRLERGPDGAVQYGESLRAETAMLAICRAALQAATRSAAESDA